MAINPEQECCCCGIKNRFCGCLDNHRIEMQAASFRAAAALQKSADELRRIAVKRYNRHAGRFNSEGRKKNPGFLPKYSSPVFKKTYTKPREERLYNFN